MAEVDIVRQAKADLIAAGKTFTTAADAFEITNLAAIRGGWKLVEKLSGDNVRGRKVDGLIIPAQGVWVDCLRGAGPPLNENEPVWQVMGPIGNLVARDPFPVDSPNPLPPPTDSQLEARVAALEERVAALEADGGGGGSQGPLEVEVEGIRLIVKPVTD